MQRFGSRTEALLFFSFYSKPIYYEWSSVCNQGDS
jgi:hypothetical protein